MAYIREQFVFAFREGVQQLATDRRLVGTDLRVLLYLLSCLEWDNHIRCVQKDMGLALGISRQSVWRAMQRLTQYGIVEPGPRFGHQPTYRLNAAIGYYGPLSRRRKERQQVIARQRLAHLTEMMAAHPDMDVMTIVR
jgi:DNA-binding IclR family transcriptional regulator